MDVSYVLKVATLVLCVFNYVLVLYSNKWKFGEIDSVGWLMAVLGWFNVIF